MESFKTWIKKSFPWILIILGLLALLLSYKTEGDLARFLTISGTAILSGGVFSVTLKSFQFVGLFKEEITNVLKSDTYKSELISAITSDDYKALIKEQILDSISNQDYTDILCEQINNAVSTERFRKSIKKDLSKIVTEHSFISSLSRDSKTKLWKQIAMEIHKDSFPNLYEKLHEKILNDYFPNDKQYYYEDFRLECSAKIANKQKKIVETIEKTYLTIIPRSTGNPIDLPFSFKTFLEKDDVPTQIEITKLICDGDDIMAKCNPDEKVIEKNDKLHTNYKYTIHLENKDKYILSRTVRKRFCIDSDPYSRYDPSTFIQKSSVFVEIKTEGLKVVFVESGTTKSFKDRNIDRKVDLGSVGKNIEKRSDELLFPGQGYVLHYQFD